jgi:hypothetical protein
MRDGSRRGTRDRAVKRHHVHANLIDFAQQEARCLHTALPDAVSPPPLLRLCRATSYSRLLLCTSGDASDSRSVFPTFICAAVEPACEGCDFARFCTWEPARQRTTPCRAPMLIRCPLVSTTVRAPARCGPRRESVACGAMRGIGHALVLTVCKKPIGSVVLLQLIGPASGTHRG